MQGIDFNSKKSIKDSMTEKFCRRCGSKLVEHFSDCYSSTTGKQLKGSHCPNLSCQEGCDHAGHIWGSFWKFQHDTCQRCGYQICDY
jgi:hypothetical protein